MTDYAKEVKARYIVPFSYILMAMGLFNGYIYYYIYHATSLALACIVCCLAAFTIPFFKKTNKGHNALANFVIIIFMICVNFIAIYTGGVKSNAIWWLGTVPLLASFLLNAFYGVVWFIVIMLNFFVVLILGKHAYLPFNILMDADPAGRMIISFTLNSTLIFILCVLTEKIRDRAFHEKEELRLRAFQLNQLASLGKLASGVAHEINNPLTVIRGAQLRISRLADRDEPLDKKALAEYMSKIQKNISRIQEVTGLMRTISSNASERTISEINIQNLLNDVVQMFSEEIHEENIEFITEFPKNPVVFNGIYTEIFQAFFNIIENAVFELNEIKNEKKVIFIKVDQTENTIEVYIHDNGRGISSYVREHIFDPFFTTKSFGNGRGLGLSFSYNVFNSNGGSIELQDSEKGTLFKIVLPNQ